MEAKKKREICDAGVNNLRFRIVEQAISDYKALLHGTKIHDSSCTIPLLEKFFRSEWCRALTDYDGEAIIRDVKHKVTEEKAVERIIREAMSSESFELWVKGCEINKTELYLLEGEKDTALYKTQSKYEFNHNYYNTPPVFHVWINGKCELATTNYQAAVKKYKRMIKEVKTNE